MKRYSRYKPWHWLLALFSNSDKMRYVDGIPDVYKRGNTEAAQRFWYWIRNPAHDFMSYIIGFKDDPRFSTWKGNPKDTLTEGWIFAIRKWRWLFLPYSAYQHTFKRGPFRWFQFYVGWRPPGKLGWKSRFVLKQSLRETIKSLLTPGEKETK